MGRPVPEPVINEEQRAWTRRATSSKALALRARIGLRCADGLANGEVADDLGVNRATVSKWRQHFVESGLDGLADAQRRGVPRTITSEHVDRVIARTLEEMPNDATH